MNSKFRQLLSLENLGGDFKRIYDDVKSGRDIMVFGLNTPERAHVAANLDRFLLYVVKDGTYALKAEEALSDYYEPDEIAYLPEKDDVLIYRKAFQATSLTKRVSVLSQLAEGKLKCCITTAAALMQYVPVKENLLAATTVISAGDNLDVYSLCDRLVAAGYRRESAVEEKCTFCLNGDILSVYPPDRDMPVRISFWGDTVENVKIYDPDTMTTVSTVQSVTVCPVNDMLVDGTYVRNALETAKIRIAKLSARAAERASEIVGELESSQVTDQSFQWLLPFVRNKMTDVADYLPKNSVVFFDEPSAVYEKMCLYERETSDRVKNLAEDGEVLKEHVGAFLCADFVCEKLKNICKVGAAQVTSSNKLISTPSALYTPRAVSVENYTFNIRQFHTDVKNYIAAGYCAVACMGDPATAKSFAESLYQEGVPSRYADDVDEWQNTLLVTPLSLKHGFCYPANRLVVIGKRDLLKGSGIRSDASKTRIFTLPKVGDYVVHEVHGIGRCIGTERIKYRDIERDYVVIEYAEGGLLQVPIDQMDRLSRYSGSDRAPKLSKLGGKDFEKTKKQVEKSIRKMAINLVELYAARHKAKGHRYPADTPEQKRFEDAFPYEETSDQLRAAAEIKADMEKGMVMDRLLCGDVGYGKTEVAFRAIFKTVMDAKQAVILAPTTILASQHYDTAKERFADFGLQIELLNRFRTKEQIAAALESAKNGKANLIIGTHRLLSKDVEFADLGLIVQDEEQRFGVEHKEKLKLLKSDVNVLTLSATPIPRTLNMALSGIRDISVLETPPSSRIPVQTYVTELTDALVRDAVGRELARGGQVFILYNRVETIAEFAEKIKALLPEARIVVGHGQMDGTELENTMQTFFSKQADVLICTTIIENGIDVPDANTLIVCDADRLGLAQLYQLRGRVGRRNRIAYAYFTTAQGKVLTSDAAKRLTAIMDFTEFGSGFKIAMRDLEIRGAGNILGREQHGHIAKIGYDLYCKLLARCVAEIRGEENEEDAEVEVNVAINAYLDSRYVSDVDARLKIFRTIADLAGPEDALGFIDKLKEHYGPVPAPLVNLVNIAVAKNYAKRLGIKKIVVADKMAEVVFKDAEHVRNQRVFNALAQMNETCNLTNDAEPKVVFDCKYLPNERKFALVCEFLSKSAKTFE